MEGPRFAGEIDMNHQTDKDDLPPSPVTEATVEKARRLEKEMLAQSARKRTPAANDNIFGEVDSQPQPPLRQESSLSYTDRDDDELVRGEDGEWVLKKYKD